MSGTQAKLNKLRMIRRKMQKEIKEIEVAVARREKSSNSQARSTRTSTSVRTSQKQVNDVRISRRSDPENNPQRHTHEQTSAAKPKINQEFNLYLLTRNLILATSNRQLKRAFNLWKKRLDAKIKASKVNTSSTRRSVKRIVKAPEVHVTPYAFKPREEKPRKIDSATLTAAYLRVGQRDESSSDSEYDLELLVPKPEPEDSEHDFTFTPEPVEAPPRPLRPSPVTNARAVVQAQPKRQMSMIKESGSSDIEDFIVLEHEMEDSSSKATETADYDSSSDEDTKPKQSPVPSAYPDELVKIDVEDGSFAIAAAGVPKHEEKSGGDEEDIAEGYIEESFSRETSPKSIVKKNFSGSLKDKLEDVMSSFSRSLPSPSPKSQRTPSQKTQTLSSGSPRIERSTPRVQERISPNRVNVFSKSSPSPARQRLNESIEYLEKTTPISRSPVRKIESGSSSSDEIEVTQGSRILHSSRDEIVKETPSPYSVKQGEFLSRLLREVPKETFHLHDDDAAVEEPTEYSVKKRSSPSKSFVSESPKGSFARVTGKDSLNESNEETEVVKESTFASSLLNVTKTSKPGRENTPTYVMATSSDSDGDADAVQIESDEMLEEDDSEVDLQAYKRIVHMDISSSLSDEE